MPTPRRSAVLLAVVCFLLGLLGGCPVREPRATAGEDVATVAQGQLHDTHDGRVTRFFAIPYAAPPVGERRWAPPAPPEPWTGTRDATTLAPPCAQGGTDLKPAPSEDCLYLNVTAPRAHSDTPRPVMVWLHGGGLQAGSPNDYDPTRMSADGDAVVVTVASRLNVLGYLGLPGLAGSGQFGLMDEQAALRWIRENIDAFGGDGRNVTLFGESGGAVRTCAHLVSPASAGLFDKAIMQSGGCSMRWPTNVTPFGSFWAPVADVQRNGRALATKLGCVDPAPVACLRSTPIDRIVAEGAVEFGQAAYDTPTLPLEPSSALEGGRFNVVPVLTGANQEEGRAFVGVSRLVGAPITPERYAALLREAYGSAAPEVAARYPISDYPGQPEAPALAWAATITARMFACPQTRDMKSIAARAPVYGYLFADPNGIGLVPFAPGFPSGASHSGELPLLFELTNGMPIDFATGKKRPLDPGQQALATTMIRYWTNFARSGVPDGDAVPDWPRFEPAPGGPVQRLAPGDVRPVDGYRAFGCDFWATVP